MDSALIARVGHVQANFERGATREREELSAHAPEIYNYTLMSLGCVKGENPFANVSAKRAWDALLAETPEADRVQLSKATSKF